MDSKLKELHEARKRLIRIKYHIPKAKPRKELKWWQKILYP